jgi:hypothetical protein
MLAHTPSFQITPGLKTHALILDNLLVKVVDLDLFLAVCRPQKFNKIP